MNSSMGIYFGANFEVSGSFEVSNCGLAFCAVTVYPFVFGILTSPHSLCLYFAVLYTIGMIFVVFGLFVRFPHG